MGTGASFFFDKGNRNNIMALRLLRLSNPIRVLCQTRSMSTGDSQQPGWGSGAGKGGGAGGSVREAGGSFGKMEAAHEEQYFRKQVQEQLEKLKEINKKADILEDVLAKLQDERDDLEKEGKELEKKMEDSLKK